MAGNMSPEKISEKDARDIDSALLYAAEGVIHEMVMNPGNVDENRALKILTPVSEFY